MLQIADQDFKVLDKQEPACPDSEQPADNWRIKTLINLTDIQNHAQEWLALERECKDPLAAFQSYVWCVSWAREFCSGLSAQPEVRIFFIYKGETLSAILPMMIQNSIRESEL